MNKKACFFILFMIFIPLQATQAREQVLINRLSHEYRAGYLDTGETVKVKFWISSIPEPSYEEFTFIDVYVFDQENYELWYNNQTYTTPFKMANVSNGDFTVKAQKNDTYYVVFDNFNKWWLGVTFSVEFRHLEISKGAERLTWIVAGGVIGVCTFGVWRSLKREPERRRKTKPSKRKTPKHFKHKKKS